MKIKLNEISIRDLTQGYANNAEEGALGYSGLLNIRPAYQREFVYKDAQRDRVIDTVRKSFPLNVMYWVKNTPAAISPDSEAENNEKDLLSLFEYEVLDGQQRIISICDYVHGTYSINELYFHSLPKDKREEILDYKLMVYFCEGTDSEKLDWFRTINIAGEKLTEQELRNAVYTGKWLSAAKKFFSKSAGPAYQLGNEYMTGVPIRQDYLEAAIRWISNDKIEWYMSNHQQKENADELIIYFKAVIDWVKLKFPKIRKEMKNVAWGELYNNHKKDELDAQELEKEVARLMADEDVTKKAGIYPYVLTKKERHLSIRAFTDNMKREAYERQSGICANKQCSKKFTESEMEADHINPWHAGGPTISTNCQMLCKSCNRTKSGV